MSDFCHHGLCKASAKSMTVSAISTLGLSKALSLEPTRSCVRKQCWHASETMKLSTHIIKTACCGRSRPMLYNGCSQPFCLVCFPCPLDISVLWCQPHCNRPSQAIKQPESNMETITPQEGWKKEPKQNFSNVHRYNT